MNFYYTLHTCLLLIISVTTLYTIIVVVRESGLMDFIKKQHTVLTGRRKTQDYANHVDIIDKYFKRRQRWKTSSLGSYLFKNTDDSVKETVKRSDRIFKVLIWRYWQWLKHRHGKIDDKWNLGECSVHNCRFSGEFNFKAADAVVVHIQKGVIPRVSTRNPKQIWIMLTDESPRHTFSLAKYPPRLADLADVFNWSMTYRLDSDIPVPYGRTLPLIDPKFADLSIEQVEDLVPYWSQKQENVLASILISNCGVKFRNDFLRKLQEHMDIDVYGKCSTNTSFNKRCPGHVKKDCPDMSNYWFYLVFENSKCKQYITEKVYQHAFDKGAIPVILGPPVEDCISLLPPNSFLHVDDFQSPRELALEMVSISNNRERLLSYHEWRNNFKAFGEHGYFNKGSQHLCRICEALNYNDDTPKVYKLNDIRQFLDPRILCS